MTPDAFSGAAEAMQDQLVAWRRDFHAHPELGLNCHRTAETVARHLKKLGMTVETGLAETGVAALLQGAHDGPVVALRVDMDALPVHEQTHLPFASSVAGVMHACGHDGHTAIGLGAASLISAVRQDLAGSVQFIFQPGEESPGGAALMIEQGVLAHPVVDAIVGLHIHPALDTGRIGVCSGTVTAGCSDLDIAISGVGGHAARPHECRDPIAAAGHFIVAVQNLVSRFTDPLDPVVLTISEIKSGSGYNVIPAQARLKGTLRYVSAAGRTGALESLRRIATGIETAFRVRIAVEIRTEEPPMCVADDLVRTAFQTAAAMRGAAKAVRITKPSMGAEDFARFADKVPAAYFRLGCHDPSRGYIHGLHTPQFDFDESILAVGAAYSARLICNLLTKCQRQEKAK